MKSTLYSFIIFITLLSINELAFGQENDSLFNRLSGITNDDFDFYNVDGYEISTLRMKAKFSKKNIRKKFRKLKINEEDLKSTDTTIISLNYYVFNSEKIDDGIILNSSYYFIKTKENEITGVTFSSYNEIDLAFERLFVSLVLNNMIPKSVYSNLSADTINFGGREIKLGGSCGWRGVNNIQCSGNGQMNWSICKSKEISEKNIRIHRTTLELHNDGKIIYDEFVDVVFEGIDTKARKIIFDFTGVTSALVGMTGGKTLTIYFISAPVRGNYISCVMSFWNNDNINESGLSPLLQEVMELK